MNNKVNVRVDAGNVIGAMEHTWNYVGYDECNYTHSPGGIKLIKKLGELGKAAADTSSEAKAGFEGPLYIRAHHMLCTGICHGFYKWGSTNAYIEDEGGAPVYNFDVIDKMCDIWLSSNCKPFFEIGFMPLDLADTRGAVDKVRYDIREYQRIGWNMPPKDYDKWYALIENMIHHLVTRYGAGEVESWYFEMWNEPDIFYWQGTHEEFCKLYDYTEAAVHAALPGARFGGPATCGGREPGGRAADYLRRFLLHCKSGKNYVTGQTGTRLDFTSFHTKGGGYGFTTGKKLERTPSVKSLLDQVRVCGGVVKECGYEGLECILSEADPDGWAAGGRFDNPAFNFRNTEYYASYVASSYKGISDLAKEMGMDFRPLAWAFMFEGERCFEGTRTFSTQGIDKAMFNTFKMLAQLGQWRVGFDSSMDRSPLAFGDDWGTGEGEGAQVGGWATLGGDSNETQAAQTLQAMIFCHEDTWAEDGIYTIDFAAENLPFGGPYRIRHYRVDKDHSNAYAEWVRQGMPDYPEGAQYDAIKARDGLEQLCPEAVIEQPMDGKIALRFYMPVKSVSLIMIEKII
ncbi:MAG: hypothetical protein FWH01_17615 [Oscillospiraceae bacterium]|nr:hypothetical protein [Oscillospiraceae bacterium]